MSLPNDLIVKKMRGVGHQSGTSKVEIALADMANQIVYSATVIFTPAGVEGTADETTPAGSKYSTVQLRSFAIAEARLGKLL